MTQFDFLIKTELDKIQAKKDALMKDYVAYKINDVEMVQRNEELEELQKTFRELLFQHEKDILTVRQGGSLV